MQRRATVVQGVHVLHVEVDGAEVVADVFGGDDPVIMAEVVFRAENAAERAEVVKTFEEWKRDAVSLTLVHGEDGVVTLVHDDGTFDASLG